MNTDDFSRDDHVVIHGGVVVIFSFNSRVMYGFSQVSLVCGWVTSYSYFYNTVFKRIDNSSAAILRFSWNAKVVI